MSIEVWPVALRAQLVRAFRPGESEKEGPFRTLRKHGWASPGVSIVCREHRRAAGRLTLFSMLSVDAARLAREGRSRDAVAFAKAATKIERGDAFQQLKELISGQPASDAATAAQGTASTPSPRLLEVMRLIAIETSRERRRCAVPVPNLEIVVGQISEKLPNAIVLETRRWKIYVPRGLCEAANRTCVGEYLAFYTQQLDRWQVIFEVVPAIAVEQVREARSSPFGRSAPIHGLTASDARLLRRAPAPLEVRVPVTIGK